MFCGKCGKKLEKNIKFCPDCGAKTEEVKEEKKTTKKVEVKEEVNEDNGSIGWAFLGFFFPIVGFILFLCWINNKKKSAKAAGLGALIGIILGIILTFLSFALFVRGIMNFNGFTSGPSYPPIIDYDDNDDDDDDLDDDKDDTKTIELTDINTDIKFKSAGHKPVLMDEFENKEYNYENIKVVRNYSQLIIRSGNDNSVLYTIDNVKNAYYHAEKDCVSRIDAMVVVTIDKVYYFDTIVHVEANMKPVELKGNYSGYYFTYNHSYTCGGSIIALGKTIDGSYYDLNGEVGIDFNNIYYYDNPDNWIGITRGYKIAGTYGTAKAVIRSNVVDGVEGIIDTYGYAYKYVYDDGAVPEVSTFEKVNNSPVKKIEYSKDDGTVILTFENNEQYSFEYAELDY